MLKDVVACCVCGIVHTGTTITMKMLRAHPELCAPSEGHVLRIKEISEIMSRKKTYGTLKSGWALTKPQLEGACKQKSLGDLYLYLRAVSRTIPDVVKDKRIVDKTPDYIYHLHECMKKSEDVPFVVLKKDPRNLYYSFKRRKMPWEKFYQLYKHSYDVSVPMCSDIFGKRLMVVNWERFILKPIKTMARICNHVGITFDRNVYTPEFFNRRFRKPLIYSYKKLKQSDISRVEKVFGKHCLDL